MDPNGDTWCTTLTTKGQGGNFKINFKKCTRHICVEQGAGAILPTIAPTIAENPNTCLSMKIKTDLWPEDVSWKLFNSGDLILDDGTINPQWLLTEKDVFTYCFPQADPLNNCWRVNVFDASSNGLCCNNGHGWYELFWGTRSNPYRTKVHHSAFSKSTFSLASDVAYEIVRGCKDNTSHSQMGSGCKISTKSQKECIFPFRDDENRLHYSCALSEKNKDMTWCATLVEPHPSRKFRRWEFCGVFDCDEKVTR